MISRDVVPRTIESTEGDRVESAFGDLSVYYVTRGSLTVDNQHVFACEFERHGVQLPSHVFLSAFSKT